MPAGYLLTKSVAGGGFLYKLGGLGDKGICGTQDVLFTRLNADGSVGPWAATTSLPGMGTTTQTATCAGVSYQISDIITGWGYEAVYSSGTVFVLGGNLWNFNSFPDGATIHFSKALFYAKANPDGTLGAWQRGPDLPAPAFFSAAAVADGVIYISGGRDDSATSFVRRDVYFSRLNADGSPGAWQVSASPLPGGLWLHASEAAAGRLYVAGGVTYDPFPRDQITNSVFSAPIAADGTLGAWVSEASLPLGLAGHGLRERHGVLYTIGGQEPDWPSVSVHASALASDGTLSAWTDSDPLPLSLYMHGSAVGGDTLYAVGGTDLQQPQKGAYYLPDLIAPAAVTDLAAVAQDSSSILLQWTAPGNDALTGAVAAGRYELRMAADAASLATAVPESWTASFEPGQTETRLVAGLGAGSPYFFSLRAADASGNLSADSNAPSAVTFFVATSAETPPVVRLESPVAGLSISPLSGAGVPPPTQAMGTPSGAAYSIAPSAVLAPQGLLSFALTPAQLSQSLVLYAYVNATVGWSSATVSAQAVDAAAKVLTAKASNTGYIGLFDPRGKPPEPPSEVSFAVKFDPKTLNLRSHGRSIKAALSASGGVRPSEIDARSVRITAVDGAPIAPIRPLSSSFEEDERDRDDHGRDGHDRDEHSRHGRHSRSSRELSLTFSRSVVAAVLPAGSPQLTLTGTLKDGRSFTALGTIRVVAPPQVASHCRPDRFWPAPASLLELKNVSRTDEPYAPKHGDKKWARRIVKEKVSVRVPEGAVAAETMLTISTTAASSEPDSHERVRKTEERGMVEVSAPVVFGPEGTVFDKPVTIELPYDRRHLRDGQDESTLSVHYWNPRSKEWEKLASTVDRQAQIVRAQTSHFSLYQVLSGASGSAPAAAADFSLREAYAFPSPVRGSGAVTIRIQPGLADSVLVHVYDLSGRKVHSSSDFRLSIVGGENTYDHLWDVSGVGSGVYTYVVVARKAGAADIRKTGKIGVIK